MNEIILLIILDLKHSNEHILSKLIIKFMNEFSIFGCVLQSKSMATAYSIGAIAAAGGRLGGEGEDGGCANDAGCVQLPMKLLRPETVMPQAAFCDVSFSKSDSVCVLTEKEVRSRLGGLVSELPRYAKSSSSSDAVGCPLGVWWWAMNVLGVDQGCGAFGSIGSFHAEIVR